MHLLTTSSGIPITYLKRFPTMDVGDLHPDSLYDQRSSDTPLLIRSYQIAEDAPNHYKINLRQSLKGLFEWYVFIDHTKILEPPNNWIVSKVPTVIKRRPVDGTTLNDDQKFSLPLGAQPLFANWVKAADNNHVEFELEESREGVNNWFAFVPQVEVEGKPLLVPAPAGS